MDLRNLGMDLRSFGIDNALLSTIQDVLDMADDHDNNSSSSMGIQNNPSRAYVRDAKAMAATPADVKEYQNSYVFIMDMPGIKGGEIKVQIEDDNVLVISGERKREKEEGVKYLRMERRVGKFMRKFSLPENANVDAISAVCQDGVLTVTVQKLPPPETLFYALQHIIDAAAAADDGGDKSVHGPTRTYVQDAKAIASTPADVIEYPNSYVFVIDMPGLKPADTKVMVEDGNVLTISGERKRGEEKEGAKYVRMERRVGKFMRKFTLPENANTDAVSALYKDGVLTVTVQKLPPPKPKNPKTVEVTIA